MAKLFAFEDEMSAVGVEETLPEEEVAEVSDMESEAVELDSGAEAVTDGVEAAGQLEELGEVVEQAQEEGGLDPIAAEAVRIAYESIMGRLGVSNAPAAKYFAAENFQSRSTRKANTALAMEASIKETLQKIWERIKDFFSNLLAKAKEFWNKMFYNADRLSKKIDAFKKEISNTEKNKPGNKAQLTLTGELGFFIASAITGDDTAKKNVQEVDVTGDEVAKGAKKQEENVENNFVARIKSIVAALRKDNGKVADDVRTFIGDVRIFNSVIKFDVKYDTSVERKDGAVTEDKIPTVVIAVDKVKGLNTDITVKMDVLTVSQMKEVLEASKDILKNVSVVKEINNQVVEEFYKASREIENSISEANRKGKEDDASAHRQVKARIARVQKKFISMTRGVMSKAHVLIYKTANAFFLVCKKNYALYTNE
jgi:hypothetical protein